MANRANYVCLAAGLIFLLSTVLASDVFAQSATGVPASSQSRSPNVESPVPPIFGGLSVVGKAFQTTSALGSGCPDVSCPSGDVCNACFVWSGMNVAATFAGVTYVGATLNAELVLDNTHTVTSGEGSGICIPTSGIGTVFLDPSKTRSISLDFTGQLCTQNVFNENLQFQGGYLVTGGTLGFSNPFGTGWVSGILGNFLRTSPNKLPIKLLGVMQK
jgi:hypothetical protein